MVIWFPANRKDRGEIHKQISHMDKCFYCGSPISRRVVLVSDKLRKQDAGYAVYRPFREPMLFDIRADGRPRFPEVSGRFRAGYKDSWKFHANGA